MRILVHTIFYRPELTGVAKYAAEMCEWLTARGHQVDVVCPPPYYPHWTVQPGYRAWAYKREVLCGVEVTRCPIWLPTRPGGLQRILYSVFFLITSLPVMMGKAFGSPDVVFVVEPSFLNTIPALLIAKLTGALAWLQIQDYEIDVAFDLGQLKRRWLRAALLRFESWVMRRFDVVSTISRSMQTKALTKGVFHDRLEFFPDWVDTEAVFPMETRSSLRAELDIPEHKIVVLFSGTLNAKQGIEVLIQAADQIHRSPEGGGILFVICGAGPAAGRLRGLAAPLPNVRFIPLQPAERLNEVLNAADIHVLPQVADVAESVLPSKLLGMLASGRPIVATVGQASEVGRLVANCGTLVRPGDARVLAAAIRDLAADPQQRARLGAEARGNALRYFQRDAILGEFERELTLRRRGAGAALRALAEGSRQRLDSSGE